MPHDELMGKINQRYLKMFNHNSQDQTESGIEHRILIQNQYFALRAVVELHKPFQYDDGAGCYYCVNHIDSNKLYEMYLYPCPTIQAIQDQLK